MSDPFKDQEWLDYAERALTELVPKVEESAIVISLVPRGKQDIKFALELGMSIMMDKPIIAVVPKGRQVPAKLVAVADALVEGDFDDPSLSGRLREAMQRVRKGLA